MKQFIQKTLNTNSKFLFASVLAISLLTSSFTFTSSTVLPPDETVCITRTGTKYHKCYHYAGRNTEITLSEAKKRGYGACKVCKPPQ